MKRFQLAALLMTLLIPSTAMAALRFYNTAGSSLGVRSELRCGTGLTCTVAAGRITATPDFAADVVGDGGDQFYGFLQNQIASTTTTLTAAQCGSTIVSNSADVVTLPEASTVLGCRFTFIVGNVSNFDINPEAADSILLLADAAGDAIRADAIGESVILEAISASAWAPVGAPQGTFSDIN